MLLNLCTWQEVERYLAGSTGVIVPIGSTEQHGPTGLIGTDTICADVIAHRVGEAADAMVAPTIAVGMAEHHMAFPGTVTYRPSTLVQVVCDHVLSLARHGFRRFMFVNGHGGNIATVNAAFYEAYAAAGDRAELAAAEIRCRLVNWWMSESVRKLSRDLYGDRNGMHAAASEIAVTQFAYPDAIKRAPLDPPVAPRGGFFGPEDFRRRFPDGRIGSDPSLARPEHGERLIAAAVKHISADYRDFTSAE